MADLDALKAALDPITAIVATIAPGAPGAAEQLADKLPVDGPELTALRQLVREGVDAGWICDREAGGVKFSRVKKATDAGELSIDAVHMHSAGPGHTHPNGEIDLCFAVEGEPTFDGRPEGWTTYPAGSWHVPTVAGGVMDILYFLPGGKIVFEDKPGS
jgi:hypothetical protein